MQSLGNGIVLGTVFDLDDPQRLGRVRVKFPHLNDQPSNWCRLSAPMGGAQRGVFFRPEVGDQMLVAFEQGNPRRPYILGGLWNETDKPPDDDGQPKKNNWRFIRSRSGHILKFDDTEGKEKIEIIANDKKRRIVIDTSGDKIEISCDAGEISIKAGKLATIEADKIEIKAKQGMKIEAGGTLDIKGATVNLN